MGSTAAAAVSDDDDSSLPSSNSGLRFSTELKRQEVRSDKRERKGEHEKVFLSLDEPEKKEKKKKENSPFKVRNHHHNTKSRHRIEHVRAEKYRPVLVRETTHPITDM